MSASACLHLIIPILNEKENLPRLFEALRVIDAQFSATHRVRIILVDDGSTDGSGSLAQDLAAGLDFTLLQHPVNLGPGRAFGTAFECLESRLGNSDWVVTLEGDNTSRHELLRQMYRRASEESYEVVLASPYMYGGKIINTSLFRVLLSSVANLVVKEVLGIQGIFTSSSFFRMYRASTIKKLQQCYGAAILERSGFECMIEMLIKLICLKTAISEVPMILDTSARRGKSKMKIFKTMRGYVHVWRLKRFWVGQALAHSEPLPGKLQLETRS